MADSRQVFFFDIDNCLYSRNKQVHEATDVLIDEFFKNALSLDQEAAQKLHIKYLNEYGLIVEGLSQNYGINPLDFNNKVDDALPLDGLLEPDPELRKMLQDIDKSKVKLWLFTNAYINHGRRVICLLGIEDQFEGLTYCDYGAKPMRCKPHLEMFIKAMREAGVEDAKSCYFVDDSAGNCRQAEKFGWTTVHLVEENIQPPKDYVCKYRVPRLSELRTIFPHLFVDHRTGGSQ